LFPEQDKPNQPKKPDEPDPRHAPRHGFCVSPVALISQYACLTPNRFFDCWVQQGHTGAVHPLILVLSDPDERTQALQLIGLDWARAQVTEQ